MQPGRARTSGFGVPLLPLARWVGWVAPVRPTHGVLVLSCPSAALRVCSVLGRWAPVHRCARAVCCGASAVSWASWLLFTGVPARCVVLHVRCPGPLGSCLPVCVLCAVRVCLGWMTPGQRTLSSVPLGQELCLQYPWAKNSVISTPGPRNLSSVALGQDLCLQYPWAKNSVISTPGPGTLSSVPLGQELCLQYPWAKNSVISTPGP